MKPKTEFRIQAEVLIAKLPERFALDNKTSPANWLIEEFDKQAKEYIKNCREKSAHPKIIVDLENCQFIDSSGLGILMLSLRSVTAYDGELVLVEMASESIKSLFDLTRMHRIFETLTMNEAMSRFRLNV